MCPCHSEAHLQSDNQSGVACTQKSDTQTESLLVGLTTHSRTHTFIGNENPTTTTPEQAAVKREQYTQNPLYPIKCSGKILDQRVDFSATSIDSLSNAVLIRSLRCDRDAVISRRTRQLSEFPGGMVLCIRDRHSTTVGTT